MNGWSNICVAVILFEGYHFRHQFIKSIASGGQFGIIVYKEIAEYSGRLIPFFAACFKPQGQFFGEPSTDVILLIWSNSELPKKSGFIKYIQAIIQPIANISTGAEQAENLSRIYGARYHRVEQYQVKGGLVLIYLAIPKSISLILNS